MDHNTTALACPFCGSHDIAVVETSTFRWRAATCNGCGALGPDVRIQTAGSGTKDEWERRAHEGAIVEWNRRSNAPIEATRFSAVASDAELEGGA